MRFPPSSTMAIEFVKFSSRAFASAALPISLAAASVSDFFVPSWAMSPLFGDRGGRCSQRDHVERVFGGLDCRRELIAVHAAGFHAAFPLDCGLDERIGLAARRNSHLVVEQLRQLEAELLFDAL